MQSAARLVALAILASGCRSAGAGGASAVTPGADDIAGTYEIRICHISGCGEGDTTRVGLIGLLVLDTADIRVEYRDTVERRAFHLEGFGYDYDPEQTGNLCYSLREGPAISDSMAGVDENGRWKWYRPEPGARRDSGVFAMTLYQSPDAGYDVTGTIRNGRLEGIGHSSGAGAVEHSFRERVVGIRLGPPKPQMCIDSMRAWIRNAPERERVLDSRMALPLPGPVILAAFSRSLRDFGFTVIDSIATAGRIRTPPRTFVTAPGEGPPPRRTWSFPHGIAFQLTSHTMPGDSSVNDVLTMAPLTPGVQPTPEMVQWRYDMLFAIWARMKEALGLAPSMWEDWRDYHVYRAVLDSLFIPRPGESSVSQVVVRDSTHVYLRERLVPGVIEAFLRLPGVDTLTIRSFESRSRIKRWLVRLDNDSWRVPLSLASTDTLASLGPDGDPDRYWRAFYARYPGSTGLIVFSSVGYNGAGDLAILSAAHGCGSLCGTGMNIVVRRTGGVWRVVATGITSAT